MHNFQPMIPKTSDHSTTPVEFKSVVSMVLLGVDATTVGCCKRSTAESLSVSDHTRMKLCMAWFLEIPHVPKEGGLFDFLQFGSVLFPIHPQHQMPSQIEWKEAHWNKLEKLLNA